ncbi:MAG: hypothetical protein AAF614_10450 [Chloroflexota bacterium]
MQAVEQVRQLGRNDLKLFGRDSFLMFMWLFVVVISVVFRYGLPPLNTYLAETGVLPSTTISQSLADFYPLLVAFMAVFQGSLITGTIFGFALLDEKDDNTIKAMLVTPMPFSRYLLFRIAVPTILAAFIVVAMVLFINQALISLWQLILISFGAALGAPIAVLFYGVFAENKVQGFAYGKFVSIAGWIILVGWFVPEPWQWLFGLFPPFWISKAYWMAYAGNGFWWIALIIGIILQLGTVWLLAKQFERVAHR